MSLPLEIWRIIIDSIHHSEKNTLLSLALVSRVVYAAVLPVLYFDVQITGHDKQQRFYEWIHSDDSFNPAGYVREFTIIITHGDIAKNRAHPHTYMTLDARLARMQHLHKLRLMLGSKVGTYTAVMTIAQPEDTPWSLPELRELQVDEYGIVKPDFLRFLSRCPALESLEIPEWRKLPSPPTDILPDLRKLSGNSSTALAFLPGRHVEELELTSDLWISNMSSYFNSNPDSAASIRSLSFPSLFYSRLAVLESMLVHLPHLKELRVCLNRLEEVKSQTGLLQRLEKLVFYIGRPLGQGDVRARRLADSLKDIPLGMGSTKPCLEFWYRTDNMTSQWRRTADGADLEPVHQDGGKDRAARYQRRRVG